MSVEKLSKKNKDSKSLKLKDKKLKVTKDKISTKDVKKVTDELKKDNCDDINGEIGNSILSESMDVCSSEINSKEINKSENCIIANIPCEKSDEMLNFLSKRGVAYNGVNVQSGNYAIIEVDNCEPVIDAFNKDSSKISESGNVIKIMGRQDKINEFMSKNEVDDNVILVKNINNKTKIKDVLKLLSNTDMIKSSSLSKTRIGGTKSNIIKIVLHKDTCSDEVIKCLDKKEVDGNKLTAEKKYSSLKTEDDCNKEEIIPTKTICIKNLPTNINYDLLKKELSFNCNYRIMNNKNRRSGILNFEKQESANLAFHQLTTKKYFDKQLSVKYISKKENVVEVPQENVDKKVIHVRNLPYELTQEQLEKEFQMADEVELLIKGNKSIGCCLLKFTSEAIAELALENLQNYTLKSRKIRVKYAPLTMSKRSKSIKKSTKKVKAKDHVITLFNLPKDVKREQIHDHFSGIKNIHYVDKDGKFLGIAEVHFISPEMAKVAMEVPTFKINNRIIRKEQKGGNWRNTNPCENNDDNSDNNADNSESDSD